MLQNKEIVFTEEYHTEKSSASVSSLLAYAFKSIYSLISSTDDEPLIIRKPFTFKSVLDVYFSQLNTYLRDNQQTCR